MAVDHYVPQFLLKNFSVDPNTRQVWAYDKSTSRSFRTNVRNIAAEKGFYRLEVGGRTLSLEQGLSSLEDKTAAIIQRIIGARSIGGLSDDDRIVIAVFVAVQMRRGPNSRAQIQALGEAVRTTLGERGFDVGSINKVAPAMLPGYAKAISILSLTDSQEFVPYILDKVWVLFETSPTVPLYISDNPIGLQNLVQKATPIYGNLGLGVTGIEVYLPISSSLSLAFYCRSHEQVIREAVDRMRSAIIRSPQQESLRLNELLEWMRAFRKGTPMTLERPHVLNQNSLQVRQAERYVYSSQPDFTLVEDMISNQPGYRTGPRPRVL
jgi:hypothetical protein